MNLIIFDIDGTILNSKAIDDRLFKKAIKDVLDIELQDNDWSHYEHVTDEGIAREAYKKVKGEEITDVKMQELKDHFLSLTKEHLEKEPEAFKPISGVRKFIKELDNQKEIAAGIATGGWESTARLKLTHAGIDPEMYPFAAAGEHVSRRSIILDVIDQARKREGERGFNRIISIGDGYWDYKAAKDLEISFIGIDTNQEGKFSKLDVDLVIRDYADNTTLLRYVLS